VCWSMRDLLAAVGADTRLLFAARSIRLFAYGALSVVLVFYLVSVGLTDARIGLLLTLTLLGDTVVSALISTRADRFGRRRMLIAGALLMVAAGFVFASTRRFWLLALAATIGVISPSGQEVGPFLSIEQAALASSTPAAKRTSLFAWYTLAGAAATALGALVAGLLTRFLQHRGIATSYGSYQAVVILYAVLGLALAAVFLRLSSGVEGSVTSTTSGTAGALASLAGLHTSRAIVLRLSALFALDAFGGGFIAQSFAAYWFHLRFGANPSVLGPVFFAANLLAGLSALLASRLASRIGLVRTMVWTHLPSNVLLILIPLMPTLPLAVAMLLVRFSISQMDVPARQSYVMAVVSPDERSAAGGITGVARTVGAALSPLFVGMLFAVPALVNWPFFIAGTLKICYDLLLYKGFRAIRPAEEV
jgi:MFS family permease